MRYTLREPGEIDLSAPDIAQWMEQAAGELEQPPETEGIVFWLYRQDTDSICSICRTRTVPCWRAG